MSVQVRHIRAFIQFAAKKLALPTLPRIHLIGSSENRMNAFGHTLGNDITVRITDRHPIDIMRTIAHELYHYKQKLSGSGGSKQSREDEANAIAGRIMKDYDTRFPGVFKDSPVKHSMAEDAGVAANAIGPGAIAMVDPKLNPAAAKRKELENHPLVMLQNRVDAMDKESKSVGKNPNPLNNTFKNGNSELKKNSTDALRQSFDREKKKHVVKKLREVTKGK